MDQRQSEKFAQALTDSRRPSPLATGRCQTSNAESSASHRQRPESEGKDPVAARKVQKADREKLRRDRLNEQFLELGHALDPDRPRNDKSSILTETIQLLKDMTSEVDRLKAEYAALSEESRELTQEKNELREEKVSLKSDIENLNIQYQQRLRVMCPWAPVDSSVVIGPHYSFPMPLAVPAAPIPIMHPSLQPFPFFGNQNPGFVPYPTPGNPQVEQQSTQYASTSRVSSKQDSRSKSSDCQRGRKCERSNDSTDVATVLELKTPGSSGHQESSSGGRKGKRSHRKEKNGSDGGCSSRVSSTQGPQESSSNTVDHVSSSE
ncbi:hypothetical protein Nepgr_026403 [Nepenthes gracilis]|uniref:BHLH domain-containing protein n=1 Tax=Nepenthes gracilis TaxID=150966 RepID=A0AAD3T6U5_NEPGR|nr:hypothetical protein Nepgr_026403 [Nepenthes gracilis]